MLRMPMLILEYFVGDASLRGNFLGGAFLRGILPCGTFPCRAFSCRASLCKTLPSPAESTSAEPSLLDLPRKTFPAEAAFICRAFLCHPSSAEADPAQPREHRNSVFNSRAQNYQSTGWAGAHAPRLSRPASAVQAPESRFQFMDTKTPHSLLKQRTQDVEFWTRDGLRSNANMTPAGLEPAIPGSVGRCLIHWAMGPDIQSNTNLLLCHVS